MSGSTNLCVRKASVGALGPFNSVRGSYEVLDCAVQETQEPAHYVEGSQYLKSLGFQHASEVARVLDIAMNPTSIYLQNKHKRRAVNVSVSVEAMRPRRWLRHVNMYELHVQQCVCLDAVELSVQARKLNVQDDMVPVCQFLQSQGMSDAQIVTVRLFLWNAIVKDCLLWHSTHVLMCKLAIHGTNRLHIISMGMIGFKLYKLVSLNIVDIMASIEVVQHECALHQMRSVSGSLVDMVLPSMIHPTPVQVVSRHPPVLSYSVQDRLKPFMNFLAEIGVPDPVHTVLQRPSLLGLDADKNLRSIVGYLQANDHSIEDICHMLETSI